jgi:MFS family permease
MRLPAAVRRRLASSDSTVLTRPFLGVLILAAIGFTEESILRAVVPLIVLDHGGDAVAVGLVAAVYSLPSVLFRPVIGDLVDTWDHRRLLRLGTAASAIIPALLLLPGLGVLFVVRFVHGAGWSVYSVAVHALMAKLAPVQRRGEASGYLQAMSAVAALLGPGLGVALYAIFPQVVPILVAMALGLVALAAAFRQTIPARSTEVPIPDPQDRRFRRLVEPSVLPATAMLASFMAANSLFVVFAPVYAIAVGAPLEVLALYYPMYGLVSLLGQLVAGRAADRLGRAAAIRLGCIAAIAGLAIAATGGGMVSLAFGSIGYGIGLSLVTSAISALTIDRAPQDRIGSAMATYSLGYGLAGAVSGAMWGAIISAFGFPWPFAVAIGLQLLAISLTFRFAGTHPVIPLDRGSP